MCYEIDVRSFSDSDGDGTGDLEGVRSRLGYLELLGVDALRLSPFYLSPGAAGGNDIAGPRAVDPLLGGLEAFEALVAEAHECGLRILLDLVPNHTSSRHTWFAEALSAAPGSRERGRYHFRDGRGSSGELPPNNWLAVDGSPAWTRTPDGQWYLHLFGPDLPDVNWAHPEVRADFDATLRFWLDRGIDGVHLLNAHAMAKPDGLPDAVSGAADPRFDNEGVHDIHLMLRKVIDQYPGTVLWGEVPVSDNGRFARYLRQDELHLAADHRLRRTAFDADAVQAVLERTLAGVEPAGAPPVWALSGTGHARLVSRYGGGGQGLHRARAMALVQLGLPGLACVSNGEELGLPGHNSTGGGRQEPIPWEGSTPLTVETQLEDESSTLSLYRHALELRREHSAFAGTELEWYGAPPGCCAYRRRPGGLVCVLNTSAAPVPLPRGEVLLSSAPLIGGQLPPDSAAWLA